MADSYFCIGIGESLIKVVDAKKTNNLIDINNIGYIQTDSTFYVADNEKNLETQSEALKKLLSSLKITKKNVNVIVPDSSTYSQIMLMPRLNEKELISAIHYQADQFVPMPIEETNIDLEILHEFELEKKLLVMMIAAPKKLIDKIQTLVEQSGLLPDSIENELSASARFVGEFNKQLLSGPSQGIAIVNIGWHSTSLYYFDPVLGLLSQTHNFKIGFDLFVKEISINTNADQQKALEILRMYDYQQPSSIPINKIIAPILNEFTAEIKRFTTLISEKNKTQVNPLYFINEVFQFPSLPVFIQQALSIQSKQLNPYSICNKNNITEIHKTELPLFISTIGGNFR